MASPARHWQARVLGRAHLEGYVATRYTTWPLSGSVMTLSVLPFKKSLICSVAALHGQSSGREALTWRSDTQFVRCTQHLASL